MYAYQKWVKNIFLFSEMKKIMGLTYIEKSHPQTVHGLCLTKKGKKEKQPNQLHQYSAFLQSTLFLILT